VVHQRVIALRVALSGLRGHILDRRVIATPERYSPEWAIEAIVQALHELLSAQGYSNDQLIAVGVGLVGLIDVNQGIVKGKKQRWQSEHKEGT